MSALDSSKRWKTAPGRASWTRRRSLQALAGGVAFAPGGPGIARAVAGKPSPALTDPDIVVALDGSGHFRSIHQALQAIPRGNAERRIVLVKNGVYRERARVDAAYVTLRGESRRHTRLEYSHPASAPIDANGRAVLDIGPTAHDFVLENLTVHNTYPVIGLHAFAVLGRADRVIIQDCDVLSLGNDTLAMWRGPMSEEEEQLPKRPGASPLSRDGGRYYHTRLAVKGSVDFICPRGWCYMADSLVLQVNPRATASVWHDGRTNPDKKFVLTSCRFDGPDEWYLARRHHDGQFFFLDCSFSRRMRDKPPYRVIYPLDGSTPTEADMKENRLRDLTNRFGERTYFSGCWREGGNFAWMQDNLAEKGQPPAAQIDALWTFAGSWDPEAEAGPGVRAIRVEDGLARLEFDRLVTVRGAPQLQFSDGSRTKYVAGSGSNALEFAAAPKARGTAVPTRLRFDEGAIIASEAVATLRMAEERLPHLSREW